ncbi:MAG: DUF4870 domain-containing protein [Chthoniobacterales bacterium]
MEPTPLPQQRASSNSRTWCVLCHASALCGFFLPAVGHIIGPLLIWLLKRDELPEIDEHGKESLNFQISLFIYAAAIVASCFVLIGLLLLPFLAVLHLANVVLVVIASIKASEGRLYRYPLTIRLIK